MSPRLHIALTRLPIGVTRKLCTWPRRALAYIVAGGLIASTALAAGNDIRGKTVDNSSTLTTAAGNNTEFNTPLEGLSGPSNVWTRELETMRASAATLPKAQARRTVTLSDADQGALFESGKDDLLPNSRAKLDAIAANLHGKLGLRLFVIGHADSQRPSAAARKRFRDNQGLSEARAFQVARYLRERLGLPPEAFSVRGEGDQKPVADNTTPEGMARNRRVELQVWYDEDEVIATSAEQPVLADHPHCGADQASSSALPVRITVDGQPLSAADNVSEADHQRCVDVAANRHDVQIVFDPLKSEPALNVSAWPNGLVEGQAVTFTTYTNYHHWIRKSELRFFVAGQDTREPPIVVLPIDAGGSLEWIPAGLPTDSFYTLRVYDDHGRFDETALKPLKILDHARPIADAASANREKLTGHGQNSLRIRNIPVLGGTVTVSGRNVSKEETVTVFGTAVPVDERGRFVTDQLLPAGTHTIDVETRTGSAQNEGQYEKYSRNLTIPRNSLFYVALGELTVSTNHTEGPALLVTQDEDHFGKSTEVSGRGAFYLKDKIDNDYLVTLSADTRERPIEDLFSNFASKDPRFLLERIDAERAYPVYGDDSTSEWDAPTDGRFYARLEHHDSHIIWGNFQTAWTGLEFNQFSRGLYGADVTWKTDAATNFGERRSTNDIFAAEPGTLNSREEFRGTGGSLYYLHRQDITRGSERVWVEIRDQTSGITLQRTQLVPDLDYEVSYLQGRILLRAPLPSVADGSTLVQQGSLSGNPVYLVSTYEYSPGLNEANSNVYGIRSSSWVNDHVRLGFSGYRQGDSADRQALGGLDMTLRYKPSTYMDVEAARSDGANAQLSSIDGGFGFNQSSTPDGRANAKRIQGVFDLSDLDAALRGRGSLYWQDRDAGFSGPGALASGDAIQQKGAAISVPLSARTSVDVKADARDQTTQRIDAQEAAVHYQVDEHWGLSAGARHDNRDNEFPNASTLLSQNGERTDAIVRLDYKPDTAKGKPLPQHPGAAGSTSGVAGSTSGGSGTTSGGSSLQGAALTSNASQVGGLTSGVPSNATNFDVTRSAVPAELAGQTSARPASWDAYTYAQGTVERTGDRDLNNRAGVGADKQITDRFRIGGELSEGTGGLGGKVSGDYQLDDRSNIYLAHTTATEQEDSNYRGRFGNTVLGGRSKLSDQVSVYDEARRTMGAGPQSLTDAFGVDLAPNDRWTYGGKMEAGTVSDPLAGDLTRRAAALSMAYKLQQTRFASSLEFRHENGTAGGRDTWLSRTATGWQLTPDWRLQNKLNFSFSTASQGNFYDGNFVDASLGTAYRPIMNDRWNVLLQYRYYYSLPSPGQVSLNDTSLNYAQRSNVVSVDTLYDVAPWLSLGGKFAERVGELRDTRAGGDWYSSRVDLIIVRSDLHLIREWDAMLEGRRLAVHEADDARAGLLAAIYRHLNKHVKLGAGYNFTDFSDDLTDLSYRSRGPFINIMSTF
jgi:outer membrane protein OmpA-like peptidoglycan-associated protein